MRTMRRSLLVWLLLALAGPLSAAPTLGVNQGWVEGGFGRDLSSGWDPDAWRALLRRTRDSGAKVLRVWLFEGHPFEGVRWELHRPAGLEPGFAEHVRALGALARAEGVAIYWTALDGNWPAYVGDGLPRERAWNVMNDRYGYGAEFRRNVLGPVLDAIMAEPQAAWGFDLINEVQGCLKGKGGFADGWTGARRFVREWADFVHQRAPGLRVTASAGHGEGSLDIVRGRYDGLGLDFYDLHTYWDGGLPPLLGRLAARHARLRGKPIVLGEVGQLSKRVDDGLQARTMESALRAAEKLGFAAVFPWRLEDRQAHDTRLSLWTDAGPRPAVEVMRRWAARWHPQPGLVGALPP